MCMGHTPAVMGLLCCGARGGQCADLMLLAAGSRQVPSCVFHQLHQLVLHSRDWCRIKLGNGLVCAAHPEQGCLLVLACLLC